MKFYKILVEGTFIGAIHSGLFVAESATGKRLFHSDEDHGQYAEYQGVLYRDYWMAPIVNEERHFIIASIQEITEEQYRIYVEAIINNIVIEDDTEEKDEEPFVPVIPEEIDGGIEFLKSSKINEMSYTCRHTIEAGFDILLSDDEIHHFSLDTQDQLNLITLSALADTQELIPYHADGEVCKFYSAAEIKQIVAAATQFKMYHTTYYNALKNYINHLDNIETIAAITYGIELPEEFQSDVLKALG